MEQRAEPEGAAKMPDDSGEHTFLRYLEEVRPAVDRRIAGCISALDPDGAMDPELVALTGIGKRLRAGVCMLSFDAFSDDPEGLGVALDLSAAIEIAHSASLVLDDMLDEDEDRRGMPALHMSKGRKKALLEAVGLLSMPYSIAARHGGGYVDDLARTHRRMVGGALAELDVKPEEMPSRLYDEVISRKTGDMFGLAARFGSSAAGCPADLVERMGRFGAAAGKAMQIGDDISDLRTPARSGGPNNASELLLLRCGGADEVLAKAIHAALRTLDLVGEAPEVPERLSAWMPVLRSSPSEIAALMMNEERTDKASHRHIP